MCTVYGVLPPPPPRTEICAKLAGNFCQWLTTAKSGANDMVWLNVLNFTASQQGGGGGGERGSCSIDVHIITLPGSGRGAGRGVACPPLDLDPQQ